MIDHELRRQCISSTDVGPIFGVDGYRDAFEVWMEKHGQAAPYDPNDRMLMGKDLEQGIVQAYSRITGKPVQWNDVTVRNASRPWMAASPDALVFPASGRLERGVDAKLVFWDQRRKWGEGAHDIPEGIQMQMWWMMAVCECEVWDVAAWMGEDTPRIYEIERDREAERVVIAKCEEWHRRYVIGNETPPITGSKAAGAWLQRTYPTHRRPDMREATEEEAAILDEYGVVRISQKQSTDRRNQLESQLKLAIADREGLQWEGGQLTWRRTRDGKKIDWESVAKGLLNQYVRDEDLRATLVGLHTSVKPGERRIHFAPKNFDLSEAE